MTTHIKHSGSFRNVTEVHVKHSGAWRDVQKVYVKHSGSWREVFSAAPTVSLYASNTAFGPIDTFCYAMRKYDADGSEYRNSTGSSSAATTFLNTWLTSGSSSGAWIERTINSGSLWSDGIGTGRPQMNTDRTIGVRDINASIGSVICNLTVRMYDASSGGNLLDSVTFSLTATYYNSCPLCCFTPDTPILLASGLQMPIGRIKPDDEVLFYDPKDRKHFAKKAGDLIVRHDRTMHAIQFEDGSVLRASDDHPLHVKNKGPASINPMYEYKGWGIPNQLLVGDVVSQPDGSFIAITAIKPIDYKGAVFTLEDSFFYANGKLVY